MYKVGRSRTPQGVRGLKHVPSARSGQAGWSHSARSAWIETNSQHVSYLRIMSHSARSAWIETSQVAESESPESSRTPQGVRGLKLSCTIARRSRLSRTPQGVRGLKQRRHIGLLPHNSRTPQGVRGLKPGNAH